MDTLPALLIVLVVAKVLGELVERAGFPALVGEIAAGALLGPALLGIVTMDDTIGTFADIGLIVLLFTSGLQLNMRSFRNSVRTGFSVALWGSSSRCSGERLPASCSGSAMSSPLSSG